jgi:hypothetical protein
VSNAGLLKYHPAEFSSFSSTSLLRSGCYDGDTKNSFFGCWDIPKRSATFNVLDDAQKRARQLKRGLKELIALGDVDNIIVNPSGKLVGNNKYKFFLQWGGNDFYIWGDPDKTPILGDVWIRYGAEPLYEYGIDETQRRALGWLSRIGFVPYPDGERLSQVDFNICVPIPVNEFESLTRKELGDFLVIKAKKEGGWRNSRKIETYSIGSHKSVLMKIYDKGAELTSRCDNFRKSTLFIQRCVGDDWFNSDLPITRVEFSVGRDWMNVYSIYSLADFRARERAIVDLLTFSWFRILAAPKVRGHENTAALHPHWLAVRQEFLRCYDGSTAPLTKVKKNVSIDLKRLGQQLLGIAIKMVAFKYGKAESDFVLRQRIYAIVRDLLKPEHREKLNNVVAAFESQKDCILGEDVGLEEFKQFTPK